MWYQGNKRELSLIVLHLAIIKHGFDVEQSHLSN